MDKLLLGLTVGFYATLTIMFKDDIVRFVRLTWKGFKNVNNDG